ncbi:MAG: Trk system potassium transporter TrkA [Alphaproteobacteria bacterium]
MKVIICGAGQVGLNLATYLAKDRHDVTVIDQSQDLINQLNEFQEVNAMLGHGASPDVLEKAGAKDADMLIAVTLIDEINMVACQIAHTLFNIPTKIARIRQQAYLMPQYGAIFHPEHVPIDHVIYPEVEVAKTIFRRVQINGSFNSIELGPARVIGLHCTDKCPIINTPLRQLTSLFPDLSINVMAINRLGKIIFPKSRDQMLVGDIVYFLTDEAHIKRSMAAFGVELESTRRAIIVGAGNIGVNLARMMMDSDLGYRCKLIENNKDRATTIAKQYPNLQVINGDGLKSEIVHEAGLDKSDVTISVTDHDETNILSSLLYKHMGVGRTVSLLNKGTFGGLVSQLGVDVIINPREITASSILQFIRRGKIKAVHSLFDGMAELMQIQAIESSNPIGNMIKELHLPQNSIVGGIIRNNSLIIPRPDTIIEANDNVIILALSDEIKKIEKLFSVGIGYFA